MKKLLMKEIEFGREKALKNANALIEDADILFKLKRYPRSFALACLGYEELGKSMMLVSVGVKSRLGHVNWKKFWHRYNNHKEKTKNILGLDYLDYLVSTKGTSEKRSFCHSLGGGNPGFKAKNKL